MAQVLYPKELSDMHVLDFFVWIDTRDMVAYGLTKGVVARDALHAVMSGELKLAHEACVWQSQPRAHPTALVHYLLPTRQVLAAISA